MLIAIRPECFNILNSNFSFDVNVDISEILGNEKIIYFKANKTLCSAVLPTEVDTAKNVRLSIDTNKLLFFDIETEKRIF